MWVISWLYQYIGIMSAKKTTAIMSNTMAGGYEDSCIVLKAERESGIGSMRYVQFEKRP